MHVQVLAGAEAVLDAREAKLLDSWQALHTQVAGLRAELAGPFAEQQQPQGLGLEGLKLVGIVLRCSILWICVLIVIVGRGCEHIENAADCTGTGGGGMGAHVEYVVAF